MVWVCAEALDAYLQTINMLQGANNGGALFVKGMGNICTGRPSGVALLTRAKEEGDLQASYVLAILKYYTMAQPTMFSTTSGTSTVMSILVNMLVHSGGWRMGTMTRMMHELWVFTTEFWRRYAV
jgi:hypothetical protein